MENPKTSQIPKRDIPLLYEDNVCAVFNKPSGLLVIPSDKGETWTLTTLVNHLHPRPEEWLPAHRLDRDTTGVILYAKGKANQDVLMDLFKHKKVHKTYIAFAHGHLKPASGKITIPVKDFYQRKFQRNMPAQSALTHYKVIGYHKDFCEVEVNPITGRTNQIRIHLMKVGHPLVGEDKYAFRKDFALRFRRTALHALRLTWPSTSGHDITVEAPLAEDMKVFLEQHL